jgi:aerobic carbon-monoxide dehydrogenase large subunit
VQCSTGTSAYAAARHGAAAGINAIFRSRSGATASGVHAMIVEVDPQTFMPQALKYVVVHGCGTIINPLILTGQIRGGVAQGIGNAFYEHSYLTNRAN